MKQILTAILIFCTFNIFGQSWQPEGTKYPNASNEGDTVSVQTRIPLIDDQGLLNYYLPVGDLLELSPNVTWETITGNQGSVNISGFNNDAGYLNNAMADGRYLQSETDPTVPNNVKNITAGNIDSWNNSLQPGENVSELNNDANYTTITATDERYLRRDIDDNNGVNELTLGGLMLPDLPVGLDTYDQLVVNPTTGEVSKVSVGAFSFDVGNGGGASQFVVDSSTPELNFVGSGDTSVSFNDATNTVTITSTPGAGGGGSVTSFEGRDGAVTSQVGDYNTSEVMENGNLYFTEGRVRGTTLDGLSISNTPITSTNSFIQALGRLQGQINNRDLTFSAGNLSIEGGNSVNLDSRYFRNDVSDTKNGTANFNGDVNIRSEARFTQDGIRGVNILTNSTDGASIGTYTSHDFEIKRGNSTKLTLTNSGIEVSGTLKIPDNVWMESTSGQLVRRTSGGFVNIGGDGTINPPVITLYVDNEIRLRNFRPIIDDSGYEWMNMTSGGYLRLGYDTPGAITLGGGVNPRWSVGSNNYDLYHQGNLRSNAQNDDRYLRRDVSDIKQGNTTFSSQIIVQGKVITSQDGIRGVNILTNSTDGASIGTYTSHDFEIKRGNSTKLTLTNSGVEVSGTITGNGSNLTNLNGSNISTGTVSYDRLPSTVARMNFSSNSGSFRTTGNIISDNNIQASSAIISGAGSFGGRVSGSDAINANEFVTRQQVVPLSTQQTGVVRAIEAISSALTVDNSVYMEKGGVAYALTVPAGTFQQSGRGIVDIEGVMEITNITQNKTLLVYITFSQGGTVYNSDPMSFNLSTTGGGAFGHFKATLTSRMSSGYFFGKGVVTGSDSNGSITQGFTINPPTSLDFRESFTIRMRVNSTSGYSMVLIPFTVKVSDLPN